MPKQKSWLDKMDTPAPHVVVLEKAFAGGQPGDRLLISSPKEIEAYVRENVPAGVAQDVRTIRDSLASRHGANVTCPLTTGIFLRTVAEVAWDALQAGAPVDAVTPFWRVIEPDSPLAAKLRAGGAWIAAQREREAIAARAGR